MRAGPASSIPQRASVSPCYWVGVWDDSWVSTADLLPNLYRHRGLRRQRHRSHRPITNATEEEIGVSLGAVFVLNSVALLIFPAIGAYLHMTQTQFGLWSALAIHDTSSVVGATAKFGAVALAVAQLSNWRALCGSCPCPSGPQWQEEQVAHPLAVVHLVLLPRGCRQHLPTCLSAGLSDTQAPWHHRLDGDALPDWNRPLHKNSPRSGRSTASSGNQSLGNRRGGIACAHY